MLQHWLYKVAYINIVQITRVDLSNRLHFLAWGQNMDQGSMDPLFGPGPWTTFMDRVHGPPVMDRVHGQFFLIMRNEQKQK